MTDQFLESLPVLSDATSAVLYGVKGGIDYQIPTSVIQTSISPQAANLVYAGPPTAPGDFPEFRYLVPADIPDLSSLYVAATGGSISTATISASTFVGGTISGAAITVNDNAFTVRDQTDTTKRFQFEAAGIAAGNTRILAVPDADTTLVGTDVVQTLTNKILRTVVPSTAAAPIRIPHGVAPTSPADGDMWTTAAGLFVRVNAATVGPLAAASGSSVNSFNGRVGTVSLLSADVTTALGYTPANASTAALDAGVVHNTGNETVLGLKTLQHTTGTGLTVERTGAATNSSIEFKSIGGSIFAGLSTATIWAINDTSNLASTPWLTVDSSGNVAGDGTFTAGINMVAGGFVSAGTRIFANGVAGTLNLRPNGSGSSTGQMTLSTTGTATAVNFAATSDARLKSDIATIKNAGELVSKMRGVSYIMHHRKDVGVVAQEMRAVLPEVVHESEEGILAVDYSHLVGVLIEAIKELQAEVKVLKGAK